MVYLNLGKELEWYKDKMWHSSGGFKIFAKVYQNSRLFWIVSLFLNANFHEGVDSIINAGSDHCKDLF